MQTVQESIRADGTTWRDLVSVTERLVERDNANTHESVLVAIALRIAISESRTPRRVKDWFRLHFMREQAANRGGFGDRNAGRSSYVGRDAARSSMSDMGYAFAWVNYYAPGFFSRADQDEVLSNFATWMDHWLKRWEDPVTRATFYPQDTDETLMMWENFQLYGELFGSSHPLYGRLTAAAAGLKTVIENAYTLPDNGTFGGGAYIVSPSYNSGDIGFMNRGRLLASDAGKRLSVDPDWSEKAAQFEIVQLLPGLKGVPVYHDLPSTFNHARDIWLPAGNMTVYSTIAAHAIGTIDRPINRVVHWVYENLPPLVQQSNPEWRAGFVWQKLLAESNHRSTSAAPETVTLPTWHFAKGAQAFAARQDWSNNANSFYSRNTKRFEVDHFGQYGLHYEIWSQGMPVTKTGTGAVQGTRGRYANVQNTWYIENAESNQFHIGVQRPNMRGGRRDSQRQTWLARGTSHGATANDKFASVSWGARNLYNSLTERAEGARFMTLASRSLVHLWDGLTVSFDHMKQNPQETADISQPRGYVREMHRKQRFESRPVLSNGWYTAEALGQNHRFRLITVDGSAPVTEVVDENAPPFSEASKNQFYPGQKAFHLNQKFLRAPEVETFAVHHWGQGRLTTPETTVAATSSNVRALFVEGLGRPRLFIFNRSPESLELNAQEWADLPASVSAGQLDLFVVGLNQSLSYEIDRSGNRVSVRAATSASATRYPTGVANLLL